MSFIIIECSMSPSGPIKTYFNWIARSPGKIFKLLASELATTRSLISQFPKTPKLFLNPIPPTPPPMSLTTTTFLYKLPMEVLKSSQKSASRSSTTTKAAYLLHMCRNFCFMSSGQHCKHRLSGLLNRKSFDVCRLC